MTPAHPLQAALQQTAVPAESKLECSTEYAAQADFPNLLLPFRNRNLNEKEQNLVNWYFSIGLKREELQWKHSEHVYRDHTVERLVKHTALVFHI